MRIELQKKYPVIQFNNSNNNATTNILYSVTSHTHTRVSEWMNERPLTTQFNCIYQQASLHDTQTACKR